MAKNSLLVVADDLTGANDTGVMFAGKGFPTILKTNAQSLVNTNFDKADVFTVFTDCRAARENAINATYDAILAGIKNGVQQLYLKIDSTMRGSVKYQIAGALNAWKTIYPNAKAVICSAYPEMGRTIEDGILYVNGIPVEDTPSGKDAICPVLSSRMQELLPESVALQITTEDELVNTIMASSAEQFVIDARTEEDLVIIGNVIAKIGNSIIPVGSAGLANRLHIQSHKSDIVCRDSISLGRSLVLVTSIHETSQQQVDEYISHAGGSSIVFNPSPLQLLNHEVSSNALKHQLSALIRSSKDNVIIRANLTKVDASEGSINSVARTLAKDLAELALFCLENEHFDSLILFGGDGAATLLEKMDVSEMRLLFSMVPGVPLCRIDDPKYQGLWVMTKSGGFGNKNLLRTIMEK
ncbi:four-carbon acid sugar kinase family protein [Gallibacterium salpingitidis]|uniref:four-carbon acid sugar kinase family protein n=1 Tax=Gallibacterium salpingitidis TaxID=505341 RepID=UPI00266EE4DE|nr:four-carbon acid sugar kinase family protein [Gallibacterium salpingitidis]WKT00100.1 four-carbon acid sugar kinase family protein [Gallibacterium salpingitidis]